MGAKTMSTLLATNATIAALGDIALARTYAVLMRLGFFDARASVPFAELGAEAVDTPAHRALAKEAADQSLVLLKARSLPLALSLALSLSCSLSLTLSLALALALALSRSLSLLLSRALSCSRALVLSRSHAPCSHALVLSYSRTLSLARARRAHGDDGVPPRRRFSVCASAPPHGAYVPAHA